MQFKIILFLVFGCVLQACQEKMTEDEIAQIGVLPCRKPASFIKSIGMDPNRSAFSSSDKTHKGIVLVQMPSSSTDTILKSYQDPSWKSFGYMGSITTDEEGNVYSAPIPFVNTLDHSLQSIHSIYRIDSKTGKMNLYLELPKIDSIAGVVPFGVLGMYYDCHGKKLYIASVGGSTHEAENGHIYVIDILSKKIIDKIAHIDPMAIFVGGSTGEKKLYIGKARSSEIVSIKLTKSGSFDGEIQPELSLDGLGPRGMDKARRIRYDQYGNLVIHGLDFSFNLAAQSNKPETIYKFGYNKEEKKWIEMK